MSNFIIQIIRSVVPIAVGWVVGVLAAANVEIDAETKANLILSISTLAASLYYVLIAWFERRWAWVGWLLGVARNPIYPTAAERHTDDIARDAREAVRVYDPETDR